MRDAPTVATSAAAEPPYPRRWRLRWRRRWLLTAVALLLVAAAAVAVAVTDPFAGGSGGGVSDNGSATSLATVVRRSLSSQTQVDGTLGYAGDYSLVNQRSGTITWLPAVGRVVKQGQALFKVDGSPVVLLSSSTPRSRPRSRSATPSRSPCRAAGRRPGACHLSARLPRARRTTPARRPSRSRSGSCIRRRAGGSTRHR